MNTLVKAILWITLSCIAFAAPASAHDLRDYRITDIGVFPQFERPTLLVSSINNRGHVTGDPRFIYRNGELEMLDVPAAAARGTGINDRDQIVGEALETSLGPMRVFLWDEGSVQFIGTPDRTGLGLNPLNDRGEFVGRHVFDSTGSRAFVYRRGSLVDLGTLGGASSFALAINNRGMIVGISEVGPDLFDRHPFLYVHGEMIDLEETLGEGARRATPVDINDAGDITGDRIAMNPDGSEQQRPFILTRGHLIDVRLPADQQAAGTAAINNRREIVGFVGSFRGQRGFHYRRGRLSLADELVSESDPLRPFVILMNAVDINDRGQILLEGLDSRSSGRRGYILTPRVLPHQLLSGMLLLAKLTHLPAPYIADLQRARAAVVHSREAAALVALERFIEGVRSNQGKRIPEWLQAELLEDAQDVAEILRGWQRAAQGGV
jgi:probable HAF family extracellular repeat protein